MCRTDNPVPDALPQGCVPVSPRRSVWTFLGGMALLLGFGYGLWLRLQLYLSNRSLWGDTAALADNLFRPYSGLFSHLDYDQSAPIGFLIVTKFIGSFFGYSELSLILFPFLCGVGSMVLFLALSCRLFGVGRAFVAFIPFALSSTAIYYSGEFKQYSADLFFATLILLLGVRAIQDGFSRRSLLWLASAGVAGVCFSHPSIIMLAGVGAGLFIGVITDRVQRPKTWLPVMVCGAVWLLSYALIYVTIYRQQSLAISSGDFYKQCYAPFPINSKAALAWYHQTFFGFFEYPLGFRVNLGLAGGFPAVAFLIGAFTLATRRLSFRTTLIIILPLILLVVASAAGYYPIATGHYEVYSRLVLFTLPIFCIMMAEGAWALAAGKSLAIQAAVVFVLLFPPVLFPQRSVLQEETRPLVDDVYHHYVPSDTLYVYYASVPAFQYYNRHYKLPFVVGESHRGEPDKYLRQIDELRQRGGRLWVLFSHTIQEEERVIVSHLDRVGRRLKYRPEAGASLYLYAPASP